MAAASRIRRGFVSACCARRRAPRRPSPGRVLQPSRKLRSVSSPFSRVKPSSSKRSLPVSRAASTAARGVSCTRRAVGRRARVFGLGARQQGGDQRAGGDPAGKRDQRRFAERVASAPVARRLHKPRSRAAVARRRRWSAVIGLVSLSVIRLSPFGLFRSSALRPCGFSSSLPPSTSLPARSNSGSRARNKAIAATTPVAATGARATASTASSAMSAPLDLAPSQASLAIEPLRA